MGNKVSWFTGMWAAWATFSAEWQLVEKAILRKIVSVLFVRRQLVESQSNRSVKILLWQSLLSQNHLWERSRSWTGWSFIGKSCTFREYRLCGLELTIRQQGQDAQIRLLLIVRINELSRLETWMSSKSELGDDQET